MNRQQRRALGRSPDPKVQEAAAQAKAMMEPARIGHIAHLQGQIETLTQYLRQKFPKDWEERTTGGVIKP